MASGTEVRRLERLTRTGIAEPQATSDVAAEREERPLWQLVVMLYGAIAFLVVFLIAVAFAIAKLVTGAAY
jgi:hypothetical protein